MALVSQNAQFLAVSGLLVGFEGTQSSDGFRASLFCDA